MSLTSAALLLAGTTSVDVHLVGSAWWSSRLDAVVTTDSADGWLGQDVATGWLLLATGVRVVL